MFSGLIALSDNILSVDIVSRVINLPFYDFTCSCIIILVSFVFTRLSFFIVQCTERLF